MSRVRASAPERRIGELSLQLEKEKPGVRSANYVAPCDVIAGKQATLAQAGISKQDARCALAVSHGILASSFASTSMTGAMTTGKFTEK